MITLPAPSRAAGVVIDPRLWGCTPGWDFWYLISPDLFTAASSSNDGLDSYGWTITSLASNALSTADLFSTSDRATNNHMACDAVNDEFISPAIFGTYDHALQAAYFLGVFPTKLVVEWIGRYSTSTANETTTFFGLCQAAVTDGVAAGSLAVVTANGTNFILKSDTQTDTGAAVDASFHVWRLEVTASQVEWFIDGASQGTIGLEADIFPVSFKMRAGTTNRLNLYMVRVFYQ